MKEAVTSSTRGGGGNGLNECSQAERMPMTGILLTSGIYFACAGQIGVISQDAYW